MIGKKEAAVEVPITKEQMLVATNIAKEESELWDKMEKLKKEGGQAIIKVTVEFLTHIFWPGYKCLGLEGLPDDLMISGVNYDPYSNSFILNVRSMSFAQKDKGEELDVYEGDANRVTITKDDFNFILNMKAEHPGKSIMEVVELSVTKAIEEMTMGQDALDEGVNHDTGN